MDKSIVKSVKSGEARVWAWRATNFDRKIKQKSYLFRALLKMKKNLRVG